MKAKKVVRVEVFQAECGNTVVAIVFGIKGGRTEYGSNAGSGVYQRKVRLFTETNRIELGWYEGYGLRHFDGVEAPAPAIHPSETILMAVEAAMREVCGWDEQEVIHNPSHIGGRRNRTNYANAA